MRIAWVIPLVLLACALPRVVLAHGGGLDANGGHMDHRTGIYHIHRPGGYSGGGFSDTSGFGYGGLGTVYSPPVARRRARTRARTAPRTAARTTAARPSLLHINVTLRGDGSAVSSPEDPEREAQELLRLAKLLIKQSKIPGALNYLKELTTKYPETKAGKDGAQLLKMLTATTGKR